LGSQFTVMFDCTTTDDADSGGRAYGGNAPSVPQSGREGADPQALIVIANSDSSDNEHDNIDDEDDSYDYNEDSSHDEDSGHDEDDNDEELDIARHALAQVSIDDPDWLGIIRELVFLLKARFRKTRQDTLLVERIDLERRICAVCTADDPDRATALSGLASSLRARFEQTGDEVLLSDAINLDREALSLRPHEHPDRALSYTNLATSLITFFQQTKEGDLLDEAVYLYREALSLRPNGHSQRAESCNNLGVSLMMRFHQSGEELLLAEALDLLREALSLRPTGHPHRPSSCNNMALLFKTWFKQTGEESLLLEAIDLHREAISLRPIGHPGQAMSYTNLASSLVALFNITEEESLLNEAIDLFRKTLSLRPSGHPRRAESCNNLGVSLMTRFHQSGEEPPTTEPIDLLREALSLRPRGHPLRALWCSNLAISLHSGFEWTGDESLLLEAIDLEKEAIEARPQHHPSRWRPIIILAYIFLECRFSQHSVAHAVNYMQQAMSHTPDDWPILLSHIARIIGRIDLTVVPQDSLHPLLQCFSAAIDLASRVAGFVLDPDSQLRYLSNSRHLGRRAYWCAVACGQPQLGLELLERARAMVWTQALHICSPELSSAPPELASELELLLNSLNTSDILPSSVSLPSEISSASRQLSLMNEDVRYGNSARLHQLIQQIRTMPGHEGFMRGLPFKKLAQCASCSAVVVLVATQGECHALILQLNEQIPHTLKLADITPGEVRNMSIINSVAQMRGSASMDDTQDYRIGMNVSSSKISSNTVLDKLWTAVVKPIIEYLQFKVCAITIS
jgi:tetratricopeptide (TPR) repeat protein